MWRKILRYPRQSSYCLLHGPWPHIPKQEPEALCELFCIAALVDANSGTIHTNLPVPTTSLRRHKYMLITYVYDVNTILAWPIKSRSRESLLDAYKSTYNFLSSRNLKPALHFMDNEVYKIDKDFVEKDKTEIYTRIKSMLLNMPFKHVKIILL